MGLGRGPWLAVRALLVAGGTRAEEVVCQPGFVVSQEVTYSAETLSGRRICEPCLELNTAYYGNNLHLTPGYGVDNYRSCRNRCREESRCRYFTYDSENAWCYLKTAKTVPAKRGKGSNDIRYTSGSRSAECQSDEENEIEDKEVDEVPFVIEEDRSLTKVAIDTSENITKTNRLEKMEIDEKKNASDIPKKRTPILSVFHKDGSRTVLNAVPASFGLDIKNDTQVVGRLVLIPSTLCSGQPGFVAPWISEWRGETGTKIFAAVRRGECRFAEKAENAVKIGFAGLVILDDQDDTDTERISGPHTENLDGIPVIFLLKTEAKILERHLLESSSLSVSIQDSSSFSWYSRRHHSQAAALEKTTDKSRFLLGMRDPASLWPRLRSPPALSSSAPPPKTPASSLPETKVLVHEEKMSTVSTKSLDNPVSRGVLDMTPLTLGSLIVGVMVLLLLITSVTTLLISRYTRKKRRRANHTRCQLAIRNMEAASPGSHDNTGFSPEEGKGGRQFPKSARNLLECPVCLELAWPPKKIFQCREGHIICDQCKNNPNLKICPMCRIPLANNLTSRNRQLEELARTLQDDSDDREPSAPPLTESPSITQSPPVSVLTVTIADVEPSSPPAEEGEEVEHHRITTSVQAGPLTVVLPPEYQQHQS